MQTTELFGARVVYDEYHLASKPELRSYLEWEDIRNLIESLKGRVILILGGDGTMLRAIQTYYQDWIPFLGINFGSKGFLLNDPAYIREGDTFESVPYPLLQIGVQTEEGNYEHVAFNEAQIKTSGGHMADLNLTINGHSHIRLRGDGLLIVTPAGSTGYNASAGGPILPHSSSHFIATPLLTFDPKHIKPIVYENQHEAKITNNIERQQAISLYADSTPVLEKYVGKVAITVKKYPQAVELLISESYRQFWDAKAFAEQGFEVK